MENGKWRMDVFLGNVMKIYRKLDLLTYLCIRFYTDNIMSNY